jgi:very-short-patch-repair endonuclease
MKSYPHHVVEIAKQLRKRATIAENVLWQRLRRKNVGGFKFRRQHHIGRYVVDFYCADLKLIIELEGGIHEKVDQKEYDSVRFKEFDAMGYKCLRIKNEEVKENVEKVIEKILAF